MTLTITLRHSIARFVDLDEAEFADLSRRMTPHTLKRKEIFQQAGEVARYIMFIESGLLRYFYLVDGEERNGQFFFEGGWMADLYSILSGEPSRMSIAAIESCKLRLLHKDDLQSLYRDIPKMERFGRLMAENAFLGSQQRTASLLNLSPEERYRKLVRNRPKVVSRVPLYHIASYLGIQPESLSRIRKRMADEARGS